MKTTQSQKYQTLFRFALLAGALIFANVIAGTYYFRWDLTKEKRYSLSGATKDLLKNIDDIVYVKIYLEGNFPAGFKRLRNSTQETLDEFRASSRGKIEYIFIDPSSGSEEEKSALYRELSEKGMQPTQLRVKSDDQFSQKIIFPWASVIYRGRETSVQLLENQIGSDEQAVLNKSIELLEYKFANGIKKIARRQRPQILFTRGQGELPDANIADIMQTLLDLQYDADTINLTLRTIPSRANVLVIAKPTRKFREQEKFKIDQFIMNGGRVFWLVDPVDADMDSLRGKTVYFAQARDVNLDDQLFKYGVRLNTDLVQDLQCNFIELVVGYLGNNPQTDLLPWYYHPVVTSANEHAIVRHLDPVALRFASTIDTVGKKDSGIRKTPLLRSSAHSKALLAPARVHFSMLKEHPDSATFNQRHLLLGALLEGKFESVFKNRVAKEFEQTLDSLGKPFRAEGDFTRMIVVADGDIIKNETGRAGGILPLGYSPDTKWTFANKDFILNCIEYLADDQRLIETRNKEVRLRLLDSAKIKAEKTKWQLLNTALPLLLVAVFGLLYNFIRKRRYAR